MLNNSEAVLLVIDLQDPLLKVIHESNRVLENSVKLIEAAKIFSMPIMVTLQYAQKLGGCTQSIADALPNDSKLDKMTFSCCGGDCFNETLQATGRKQVLICGIETHVCVNQTAHDLLAMGYSVQIARDAVSSRTADNWNTGIEKMRDSGCVITSTETAIFELTRDASAPEFKKILPLVK